MSTKRNYINCFSLMNFWVLGFLLHLGFSSFFLLFSLIGIEYVYVPKVLIVECTSNQEVYKTSLKTIDIKLLGVSLIQQGKRKLRNFVDTSVISLILKVQYKFCFYHQDNYFNRAILGLLQRGPPA